MAKRDRSMEKPGVNWVPVLVCVPVVIVVWALIIWWTLTIVNWFGRS